MASYPFKQLKDCTFGNLFQVCQYWIEYLSIPKYYKGDNQVLVTLKKFSEFYIKYNKYEIFNKLFTEFPINNKIYTNKNVFCGIKGVKINELIFIILNCIEYLINSKYINNKLLGKMKKFYVTFTKNGKEYNICNTIKNIIKDNIYSVFNKYYQSNIDFQNKCKIVIESINNPIIDNNFVSIIFNQYLTNINKYKIKISKSSNISISTILLNLVRNMSIIKNDNINDIIIPFISDINKNIDINYLCEIYVNDLKCINVNLINNYKNSINNIYISLLLICYRLYNLHNQNLSKYLTITGGVYRFNVINKVYDILEDNGLFFDANKYNQVITYDEYDTLAIYENNSIDQEIELDGFEIFEKEIDNDFEKEIDDNFKKEIYDDFEKEIDDDFEKKNDYNCFNIISIFSNLFTKMW